MSRGDIADTVPGYPYWRQHFSARLVRWQRGWGIAFGASPIVLVVAVATKGNGSEGTVAWVAGLCALLIAASIMSHRSAGRHLEGRMPTPAVRTGRDGSAEAVIAGPKSANPLGLVSSVCGVALITEQSVMLSLGGRVDDADAGTLRTLWIVGAAVVLLTVLAYLCAPSSMLRCGGSGVTLGSVGGIVGRRMRVKLIPWDSVSGVEVHEISLASQWDLSSIQQVILHIDAEFIAAHAAAIKKLRKFGVRRDGSIVLAVAAFPVNCNVLVTLIEEQRKAHAAGESLSAAALREMTRVPPLEEQLKADYRVA